MARPGDRDYGFDFLTREERKRIRRNRKQLRKVHWQPPVFPLQTQPHGHLHPTRECQGLWYYYLAAQQLWEKTEAPDAIVVVAAGDEWKSVERPKYRQLFIQTAVMYGVEPAAMSQCWDAIDMECFRQGVPLMVKEDWIRFETRITLETRH